MRSELHAADRVYHVVDVALVTQPANNFVAITCHVKPFFHLPSRGREREREEGGGGGKEEGEYTST